ncbi:hypothetical protein QUB05_22690 [Microcoleus sp. F10-C6]|uniref:hypothetical protein n=1 Tax=unclassified Microcoleus TaxID=2642155 RepID=UPI002FD489B0
MPIPVRKIKIQLEKAQPTQLTVDTLKQQLNSIGLTCPDSATDKLDGYIQDVKNTIPSGRVQSYGIFTPQEGENNQLAYRSEFDVESLVERGLGDEIVYRGLAPSSEGNWRPDGSAAGYTAELSTIQFPLHFDYLLSNKPGFGGIKNEQPTYADKYDTIDAIKQLFVQVGVNASATLVQGLDRQALESVLSNAIAPLNDQQAQDYDKTDSRAIFLVLNYDPDKTEADGIGVLTINWRLRIKDYKEKKTALKHDTTLDINCRSILYTDIAPLLSDYMFITSHFKERLFKVFNSARAIPIKPSKIEIFTTKPPANADTFLKSLPKIAKEDFVEVIVLYAPDLNNIGCLDNTDSPAQSTYSISVSEGFTFSTSQSFSIENSFEASIEFIKASTKIGFSLTFTEEWSEVKTETIEISVPSGQKAFTYQGYLRSVILRFNPSDRTYKYVEYGKLKTNVVKTTKTPLEDVQSLLP